MPGDGTAGSGWTCHCGAWVSWGSPHSCSPNPFTPLGPGNAYYCPECTGPIERRSVLQPCTDAQLDAVAADYAETMRCRGFAIGVPEETAIRRAATIQDAWRVAFARVLK
jgi:hypothetical protein